MTKRVWLLPIEPFDDRYTEQWFRWFPEDLAADGWEVNMIFPADVVVDGVGGGEFLDPVRTWEWKGAQVAELARAWPAIQDGDWILSLDGWGPATTAALYMRDATEKKVKVAAFMHAGCWDEHDFLSRQGMNRWASDIETGWINGLDLVLCGSEFAKNLMIDYGSPVEHRKIVATGNPIKRAELVSRAVPVPWVERERLVCFPHRLAPEKDPEMFDRIVATYRNLYGDDGARFVRSVDVCKSKDQYYRLLSESRVVVSTAWQETFGIAMQEGIALGAYAVCPDALSYPDVVRPGTGTLAARGRWRLGPRRSSDFAHSAAAAIRKYLGADHGPPWDGWHENAIGRIGAVMELAS